MNPRVANIPPSLIREIASRRRPTSIDLGLGEPSLLPHASHLDAGIAYAREHGLRYTVNAGDAELRAAIARHYAYPGMQTADNVCITTGSQEATYVAIKTLLNPECDELLVVEPAFPSYGKMAALEGIRVQRVSMREEDDFGFDAERIGNAVTEATRMIVICSPCNPTARVISGDQVNVLARALERRGADVWVLHDEIYREQSYSKDPGYFGRAYEKTVVTNSVSKSNALTGLRLGWVIAPTDAAAAMVRVHAWLTSCADTFAQHAALHIFRTNALREHAHWYEARARDVTAQLAASGLRHIAPEGSFYACVRLADGEDSLAAALRLADTHDVIAIPGIAFGAAFANWLRLSWVSSSEQFGEGLRRIESFLSRS